MTENKSDKSEKKQEYPRKAKELLKIIKAGDREDCLVETVQREFAHPFSMTTLWICREYIHKLPEEVYHRNTPESMEFVALRALLATMEGDLQGAETYAGILGKTPRHLCSECLEEQDWYRIVLELVMPYVSDNQFLHIICFLRQIGANPVQSLTLSANRPSILNGFRDFTRFGRYLEKNKSLIMEIVGTLYGENGRGVCEIMLAEWYYQNNDCFHALVLVTGTIPMMESAKDMQCLFAGMALQMKILLLNGQSQAAAPLVEKVRRRIQSTGWEELTSSLNAMEARAACYEGRQDVVQEWLTRNAPDENGELYMMDMYAYLIKIRCYLMMGKYMMAHVLAKQLIHLLKPANRYMDLCECYMLSAFACYKAGSEEDMCGELEKALYLAKRYKYIRLLADEGESMVRLLSLYEERVGADAFTEKIKGLAMEVARQCPRYLRRPWEDYEPLTRVESYVLHLLSQERTNEEIAENLNIKIGTVKFHITNINRKLRVKNRRQAVRRARELSLLREE